LKDYRTYLQDNGMYGKNLLPTESMPEMFIYLLVQTVIFCDERIIGIALQVDQNSGYFVLKRELQH
jgi:hypothetical protein